MADKLLTCNIDRILLGLRSQRKGVLTYKLMLVARVVLDYVQGEGISLTVLSF